MVVHATEYTFRVFVTVQVLDPTDQDRLATRSNRLIFVFAAQPWMEWKDCHFVVLQTYPEVFMQVEATRQYASKVTAMPKLGLFWMKRR
mmetsp:Transcript_689/g.1342  ORF Transcript_689/g.1342 Transcript_689/m.1342 type:complete len:89 (+) Transcript_689:274-540(+)